MTTVNLAWATVNTAAQGKLQGGQLRMAAERQETYIRQLLDAHARAPEVIVAWQGRLPERHRFATSPCGEPDRL